MMYPFVKRIFDIVFAVVLLPVCGLLFIVLAPLIFLVDRGPILYTGSRLGKNNTEFRMYKFRTMYKNSPDIRNNDGSTYNSSNDSRVTPIGRFLRKTSLDEIPQILNIIKGEMSFIGPRPDLPDAINIYRGLESRRNEVRPGISGYSQAYFRNNQELHDRFSTDVYYVENMSFLFDLRIVLKTVSTIVARNNIYRN